METAIITGCNRGLGEGIRNIFAFKVYTKLSGKANLKAAIYQLSPNMGTRKIVDILYKGKGLHSNEISITLKEGYDIKKLISILSVSSKYSL